MNTINGCKKLNNANNNPHNSLCKHNFEQNMTVEVSRRFDQEL